MEEYKIYTDGAARGNPGPAASAYIIVRNDKVLIKDGQYIGKTTNNVAEYTAIILALERMMEYGKIKITLFSDSQLAIKQLKGEWKINKDHLRALNRKVKRLLESFEIVNFVHVPRTTPMISDVDGLANEILDERP